MTYRVCCDLRITADSPEQALSCAAAVVEYGGADSIHGVGLAEGDVSVEAYDRKGGDA